MGLADALFAGLGQGLQAGATNYVDGVQKQQQLDRQARQDDLARREAEQRMAIQQGTYDRGVASDNIARIDQTGQSYINNGQGGLAAGMIPSLNQHRQALGLPGVTPVLGSPVAPTPGMPYQGPSPTGDSLGSSPDTPHPNDFSSEGSQKGLAAAFNYTPPKPLEISPGASFYDPRTYSLLGTAPERTPKPQLTQMMGGDGLVHTGYANPTTGAWTDLGVSGKQGEINAAGSRQDKSIAAAGTRQATGIAATNYRVDAKTAATHAQALAAHVHDLASQFGGTVTSEGIRPVGSPTDTAATIVDGHQTQWGLYNSKPAGEAAKPGTSDHGDGQAVDISVPLAQRDAFKKEAAARGLAVLDEGDHLHLTAPGALAPPNRGGSSQKMGWVQQADGSKVWGPLTAGTVAAPKAANTRPFNDNAFIHSWTAVNTRLGGKGPLVGDEQARLGAALAKAKSNYAAQQGGGSAVAPKSDLQKLIDLSNAEGK